MSLLTRGAVFLGGLFGLSWAGESIASKIGKLLSYVVFGVAGILAIKPQSGAKMPLIGSFFGGIKTKSLRFGGAIVAGLMGLYLFAGAVISKYRDLTKPWYQFW